MIDYPSRIGAGEAIRTPDPNLGKVECSREICREPALLPFSTEERVSNGSRTRENVIPRNSQIAHAGGAWRSVLQNRSGVQV